MQEKNNFFSKIEQFCSKIDKFVLYFTHLFVPLTYRSKVLSFGNEKKDKFSFCISLIYSYLCGCNENNADHSQSHLAVYLRRRDTLLDVSWRRLAAHHGCDAA